MCKIALLSLYIFVISFNLKASIFSTDSLIQPSVFHDQLLDSIKKVKLLRSSSPTECLKFGERVIDMARETDIPSLIGLAEKTQGVSYFYQGVFDSALHHYNKAIPKFLEAKQELDVGKVYNNIAIIYRRTSKSELALENYLKAKEIYEQVDYVKGIASIYSNVGGVYYNLGNYKETERYYLLSLALLEKLNFGARIAKVNMNLGVLYLGQGQLDKASVYLNKANILTEEYGKLRDKGEVLINLGDLAFYKKEYKKALDLYVKCESIRLQINDYWGLPKNYIFTAKCLTEIGRYKEALVKLKESETICLQYNLREDLHDTYVQQSILFEKMKEFEQALIYHKKNVEIRDSIDKSNRSKTLEKLEFTHFLDLKEKELAIKDLDLSRKNILLLSLLGFILFGVAFILFYLRSRSHQNKLQTLSLEQKIRLSQMNPHFLFNSLSVIQDFILDRENDKAFNYMSKLTGLIRGVLENSTQDYITVREELDILTAYIELQNLRFDNDISYRFDIDSDIDLDEIRIPPMLAQPIIENALIHGELRNNPDAEIKICLLKNVDKDSIDFTIEDNGVGINSKQKSLSMHKPMATDILKDRVRIYNYYSKDDLSIEVIDLKGLNKDLHGTRVRFSIPLFMN